MPTPMFQFEGNQSVREAQQQLLKVRENETLSKQQQEEAENLILRMALDQERAHEQREGSYQHAPGYNALILNAFPPLPQAAAAQKDAAPEANLGYKERKRRRKAQQKEYDQLGASGKLISYSDVQKLPLFRTSEGRAKWAAKKLSHSDLTMGETVKMMARGDYSNFENLDNVMRGMFAGEALERMLNKYQLREPTQMEAHTPEEICARIRQEGGVSALLDPTLRLGLSLAQKETLRFEAGQREWFRKLDEQMSTAVMLETLTHRTSYADLKETLMTGQHLSDAAAGEKAQQMIEAGNAQQIQIAKRLLLMHLGKFTQVNKDGKDDDWNRPVAVALSHCSRVTLTLPKQTSNSEKDRNAYRDMWRSIFYQKDSTNPARDDKRPSSTHNLKIGRRATDVKEKKVLFNLSGQRGMNVAIGGLGNSGISGRTILNDGSCGHFYSMYKEGDTSQFGAILMGLESDSYGVTNQLGHTHDTKATGEKASSLGGQRADEIGLKYGGRRCSLETLAPEQITEYMENLEDAMKRWQASEAGLGSADAAFVMQKLTGAHMSKPELKDLLARLSSAS